MNEYRDIHASLLRFLQGFATRETAAGGAVSALNLDGFASPMDWPEKDFVALSEFQMDVEEAFVRPAIAFVISTRNDKNLFRMEEITNRLLNELLPTKRVEIVDAVTGAPRGYLNVLNRTRVGSVLHTDTQPARPIFVTFKSDQTLRLDSR